LTVMTFLAIFIREPVQALEENLECMAWLGVAYNTYWTQLLYANDTKTIQADLRAVTDDYAAMVAKLINKHDKLRKKRPGASVSQPGPKESGDSNQKPSTPAGGQSSGPATPA
jgi:hypothetical protein